MEHVKRQTQQGQGTPIMWMGVLHSTRRCCSANQFDIDISKAQAIRSTHRLLQNKAEFIALMLGIEIVKRSGSEKSGQLSF